MSAFTPENRNCVWCGRSFVATRPDRVLCSHKCSVYRIRAQASRERREHERRQQESVTKLRVSVRLKPLEADDFKPLRHNERKDFDEAGWRAMANEKNSRLNNHAYAVKMPADYHASNV